MGVMGGKKKKVALVAFQGTLMNCEFRPALKPARAIKPCIMWCHRDGNETVPPSFQRATHDEEQKKMNNKRQIPPTWWWWVEGIQH